MTQPAQDIISLPIELTGKRSYSKFRLVHIATHRVRQLVENAPLLVTTKSIKDTTISLEESLTGNLKVIVGEDAKKARDEYRKKREREKIEEQLSAKEEEIRKELSAYLSETQDGSEAEEAGLSEVSEEEPAEETEESEESEEAEEAGEDKA